jgi:polyhydroxyalkanoate synthase subunit PhaC
MDLIPKPDQVASAASNVAHMLIYGGLADLRPMPRTLIDDGPLREVYHYRPQKKTRETGDPVLLVTPLAAPAICFDLRRGCSLVEHFVQKGRPTYLVEYGEIAFKNRRLGMEHWIDEVIPEAIKTVSEHAGDRPVHVIGWSLGGIFAALTAADRPDLPIASLTVLGSPFDVKQVPMVAPLRPILRLTDGGIVTQLYRVLGGAPKPLVRRAFQLSSGTKLITKPIAIMQNLDDSEWLAQIEAVDRFTAGMIAYPGRSFGQLYHRMLKHNQLLTGKVNLSGGHEIDVANIKVPVLIFAGNTDGIAPVNSVKAMVKLLPNAHEVRFEIVPGGERRGSRWTSGSSSTPPRTTVRPAAPAARRARRRRRWPHARPPRRSRPRVLPGRRTRSPLTARRSAPTPSAGLPRRPPGISPASLEADPPAHPRAGTAPRRCGVHGGARPVAGRAGHPRSGGADVPPLRRDG